MLPTPHSTDTQTATIDPTKADAATVLEERRGSPRVQEELPAQLIGLGCTRAVSCAIQNVAEGGLYVLAPAESGLGVGRRYEVVLNEETVPAPLAGAMIGGCYATVVRTELLLDAPERLIGAGMRFDQPLML
jgi:hypothetical protein